MFLLFILFILAPIYCDPYFTDVIYQSIPHKFCSRYYHQNGGIGCRTPLAGVSGVLLAAGSIEDVTKISTESTFSSIVLLVNSTNLTSELITEVTKTKTIVGIAIVGTASPNEPYSVFAKCPDGLDTPTANISLHSDYEWNPHGNGMFYEDLPISYIHITDEKTISLLYSKAQHNAQSSVPNPFIMEMNSYMGPDIMNSTQCLKRHNCLPLGGQSIWSLAPSPAIPHITLIATAMDSLSEIYDHSADGSNAGIRVSVLLAIAQALHSIQSTQTINKRIMFAFFEGEQWGRVGSRYFISDILNFTCLKEVDSLNSPFNTPMCSSPLRLSLQFKQLDLKYFTQVIILDQLIPFKNTLYFHSEPSYQLSYHHHTLPIKPSSIKKLPPGPGETFYKAGVTRTVVISGYDDHFMTSYNSIFETEFNETDVELISNSILSFILPNKAITVNSTYLHSVLACLAIDGQCAIIEKTLNLPVDSITQQTHHLPLMKYTGILTQGRYPLIAVSGSDYVVETKENLTAQSSLYFTPTVYESFLHTSLSLFVSPNITTIPCSSFHDCHSVSNGYCIQGHCVGSNAYFHPAMDPAIELTDVNQFKVRDDVKDSPVYTEPYWGGIYGALPHVKKISAVVEWVPFVIGLLITIAAYYVTKYVFDTYGNQLKLNK